MIKVEKQDRFILQFLAVMILIIGATWYIKDHPVSTIFKASNTEKQVKLSFVPNTVSPKVGETIKVTPILFSQAKHPGVVILSFKYDSAHLEFLNAEDVRLSDKFEVVEPAQDQTFETDGQIKHAVSISYAIKNPENLPGETVELSTLSFKVKSNSKSDILLDNSASQIIFTDQDEADLTSDFTVVDSLIKPTETKTPETTVSPTTEVEKPSVTQPSDTIASTVTPKGLPTAIPIVSVVEMTVSSTAPPTTQVPVQ
jgi:hypothetical protein